MKSYRENPEGGDNQCATKQNEREIFAAKMAATIRENRIVDNPRAEHWKKAYDEMADIAMMMLDALCVIRDKADPYTHQIHWCRQKAAETVEKANAAFRSNRKLQRNHIPEKWFGERVHWMGGLHNVEIKNIDQLLPYNQEN